MIRNYSLQNWVERRKYLCDWLLIHHNVQMTKVEVKLKWLRSYMLKTEKRTHQMNYSCPKFSETYLNEDGTERIVSEAEYNGRNFNKKWNLREIQLSEGVFEFEKGTKEQNLNATWQACIDLVRHKIHFAMFYAQGMRVPHIHAYNLFPNVKDWAEKELSYHLFAQKVFSIEIRPLMDLSLAGQQNIALEFSKHWKTEHMKKLLFEHTPEVKNASA